MEKLIIRHVHLLQGYNGSQLWDAAFAVQAFLSTELTEEYNSTLRKAHMFIKNSQVKLVFMCYNFNQKLLLLVWFKKLSTCKDLLSVYCCLKGGK